MSAGEARAGRRGAGGLEHPGFSSEAAMVGALVAALPRSLGFRKHRYSVHLEVGVGRGIADIVVMLWDDHLGIAPLPLSARDSVVLAALRRRGPTRIDILEARCGLERGELRAGQLESLEQRNLVRRGAGGRVSLESDWASRVEIVAIEAKLSEWRTAIGQANRYLRYADRAFVAVPEGLAERLGRDDQPFRQAAVGLLGVGEGELRLAFPAPKSDLHDWRREFAVSRLITTGQGGVRA